MRLRKKSDEVFVAEEGIIDLGDEALALVKRQAAASTRRRARICAHRDGSDPVHEMLIAISADSYIHPHRHLAKAESFHIVEGEVDVVIFDDAGGIDRVVALGASGTGRSFFYRLSESRYHTLIIRSKMLVVHEVTAGPFERAGTVNAPFAPGEDEPARATAYMLELAGRVAAYHAARRSRAGAVGA